MTITVGVPALGPAAWPFVESLVAMEFPPGEARRLMIAGPLAVDVARNQIVRRFLATPDRWLLMVDSDMVFAPGTLRRLLSWDLPVVTPLMFQRHGPLPPLIMRGTGENAAGQHGHAIQLQETREWLTAHGELVSSRPVILDPAPADCLTEVTTLGGGCMLIRRDALDALGLEDGWFRCDPGKHNMEDIRFGEALADAGVPMFVDRSCMVAHLYGDRPLAALDWLVWDKVSDYE